MCMCACMRACVRACVSACVRACVRVVLLNKILFYAGICDEAGLFVMQCYDASIIIIHI